MNLTNQLRKRFCKEAGIPITIYDEPYFSERLDTYNKIVPVKEKWSVFLKCLEYYNTEQDFYEDYNRVKESIIEHIKQTPGYQRFNELDMNQYKAINSGYPSKDVYKEPNNEKWFLSIDMIQANFTSLNCFEPSIFNSCCWEDYISRFTNNTHFIQSKYMRQVIMGALNPKRQTTYEKHLMDFIMTEIVSAGYANQIEVFTNDEIVIRMDSASDYNSILRHLDSTTSDSIRLKTTLFKLTRNKNYSGYILHTYDYLTEAMLQNNQLPAAKEIKFKGVNSLDYPFLVRDCLDEKVSENDKVFVYNNRLAKFI